MLDKIEIGGRELQIEINKVAGNADGSCLLRYGDTIVLVTACRGQREESHIVPLICDYREKRDAAGKIPGGFFKREGKPTDKEVLSARLIDRPIRPLFPPDFRDSIHIVGNVLSFDQENDADVLAINGASISLLSGGIPFEGPVGAVRIGLIGGEFVINPTYSELEESKLNMVVAGTVKGITMIEASAKEVPEKDIIKALEIAEKEIKRICEWQEKFKKESNYEPLKPSDELKELLRKDYFDKLKELAEIKDRKERKLKVQEIEQEAKEKFKEQYSEIEIDMVFEEMKKEIVRDMILKSGVRLDGRGPADMRPITCEVGLLPRAHGSALFTRGETQSLCTTTLGTKEDEQKLDELFEEETWKSFMLHYNFLPFSTGDTKPLRAPSRREIGHGFLAERALEAVIPSPDDFPYTIRVVSDILSSNGSSSMATVCSASMSLMDAGVPIKTHVAGVAMGLVDEIVLTDIIGEEDHYGDMDFKIAGTKDGITAIQLDIKKKGLSLDLLAKAIEQSREARMKTLDYLFGTIKKPRSISQYAPKLVVVPVPPERAAMVVGPGGKVVREIKERTGADVFVDFNESKVYIKAQTESSAQRAAEIVRNIVEDVEIGKIYIGRVTRILPYGAIVEIAPGKEGMIHISQLDKRRVRRVEDVLKVGDEVACKVIDVDPLGRPILSRKALLH